VINRARGCLNGIHPTSSSTPGTGAPGSSTAPGNAGAPGTGGAPGTEGAAVGAQSAGTVTSYVNGVLTLTLNDGSTVSATVTGRTEIECEPAKPTPVARAADHGGSGPSRNDGHGGGQGNHDQNDNDGPGGNQGEQDQNDNDGPPNDNHDESSVCDTSALIPGAVVHAAELRIDPAGSRFTSIEISR
jgi:hypothetical protein